jgi:hypothetical protein
MPYRFSLLGLDFIILDQPPYIDEQFDQTSLEFFDRANDDTSLHDSYFSHIAAIINNTFFPRELWHRAEAFWRRVVQPALDWETRHPGRFIHKGTPFYFWGMAAISRGELDMGYPLMHQALQEDIRTQRNQRPNTPAYAFATLDYTKLDQAFRDWTEYQARFIEPILENYHLAYARGLNLDDFQRRFLVSPPSLDIVFLFAYALGRFSLFDRVPPYARQNDFTSQLELNLLFDIVLVIDASIKARDPNPDDNNFSLYATFLSCRAVLGLTQQNIQGEINPAFQANFNLALDNILNGIFHFQDGTGLTGLARDLAVAYALRNYGAHNISSVPTVQLRFSEICQSLFNTLFLTIETLY